MAGTVAPTIRKRRTQIREGGRCGGDVQIPRRIGRSSARQRRTGFDCGKRRWRPSTSHPAAAAQVATEQAIVSRESGCTLSATMVCAPEVAGWADRHGGWAAPVCRGVPCAIPGGSGRTNNRIRYRRNQRIGLTLRQDGNASGPIPSLLDQHQARPGPRVAYGGHKGKADTSIRPPPHYFFSKLNATELMQYRSPVGSGPSGNTCPR